jgi:hypothetical protein
VPAVGLACVLSNGLYRLVREDGSLGDTTHGPDALAEPGPGTSWWPDRQPRCVDAALAANYIQVVYAVPQDAEDRFEGQLEPLRVSVRQSNGQLDWSATRNGVHADLLVACIDGDIDVQHTVLPISKGGDSFGPITNALAAQGFNRDGVKYWVLYDDAVAGAGGQANIRSDDRLAEDNGNNGGAAMYALSYGPSTHTMLHEIGHSLGAVQPSAPHSTSGWHCTDGLDVMCYDDRSCTGPVGIGVNTAGSCTSGPYRSDACVFGALDCNQDDYFHSAPPAGHYLTSHWNVASPFNHYIHYGGSFLSAPDCDLRQRMEAACVLWGGNPESTAVEISLDWGDGTQTTTKSAPGAPSDVSHRYAEPGVYPVEAIARDLSPPFRQSAPVRWSFDVREHWTPEGLSVSCPAFHQRVLALTCTAVASDVEEDELEYVFDWGDGVSERWPPHGAAAGETVSATHDYLADGVFSINVKAMETKRPHLETDPIVRMTDVFLREDSGPTIEILDPLAPAVYVGCTRTEVPSDAPEFKQAIAVGSGCLRARFADDHTGVSSIRIQIPAACSGSTERAFGAGTTFVELSYPICHSGDFPILITALDGWGNPSQANVTVEHFQEMTPELEDALDTAVRLAETVARLLLSCAGQNAPGVDCSLG